MSNTDISQTNHALQLYRENPDSVVVCHICDQIYEAPVLEEHQTAHCHRCHVAIAFPHHLKVEHTIALSITSIFLMAGSLRYEFLGVSEAGLEQKATLIDIVAAFNSGWYVLLGLFVIAFVIGLPLIRALTLIYVMWPLMFDKPPLPSARKVFTFSQSLAPWLMTEIFIIGTAVSLVKMVGLATVELGPSLGIFILLVMCMAMMSLTVHHRAVWDVLREAEIDDRA